MAVKLKVDGGMAEAGMPDTFEEFRQLQKLCDFEIHSAAGRIHKSHKLILASRSNYFDHMFCSSFEEAKQSVVNMQEDAEVIDEVLRYVYTGVVHITGENAQDLLRVGDQYRLPALFSAVEKHIMENVDTDNCVNFLKVARQLNAKVLENQSWTVIENNLAKVSSFEEMDKVDVIKLSEKRILHEDFIPKFLVWFLERNDVDAAVEVLKNIDFTKMDKQTISEMKVVFANTMPCIIVILQKMIEDWPCAKSKEKFDKPLSAQLTPAPYITVSPNPVICDANSFSLKRIAGNSMSVTKEEGEDRNFLLLLEQGVLISYAFCDFSASKTCELALPGGSKIDWDFSVYYSAKLDCIASIGNRQERHGAQCSYVVVSASPSFKSVDKEFSITVNQIPKTMTIWKMKNSQTKTRYAFLFYRYGECQYLHECDFYDKSDETTIPGLVDDDNVIIIYELAPR